MKLDPGSAWKIALAARESPNRRPGGAAVQGEQRAAVHAPRRVEPGAELGAGRGRGLALPRESATTTQGLREIVSPQEASALLRGLPKATR